MLARAALLTPKTWLVVATLLDRQLAPWIEPYRSVAPSRIVEVFARDSHVTHGLELESMLWVLLRRREPTLVKIVERLAEEIEIDVFRSSSARPMRERLS